MISYLEGKVLDYSQSPLTIVCNGVGYEVHMSPRTIAALGTSNEVQVYIQQTFRENASELFGFASLQDKTMFQLLCKVHKIGARTAMAILGELGVPELVSALRSSDTAALSRVPGIGKKTAERLLIELRDLAADFTVSTNPAVGTSSASDASTALVALGFGLSEANDAVTRILGNSPDAGIDEIVRQALQGA